MSRVQELNYFKNPDDLTVILLLSCLFVLVQGPNNYQIKSNGFCLFLPEISVVSQYFVMTCSKLCFQTVRGPACLFRSGGIATFADTRFSYVRHAVSNRNFKDYEDQNKS